MNKLGLLLCCIKQLIHTISGVVILIYRVNRGHMLKQKIISWYLKDLF